MNARILRVIAVVMVVSAMASSACSADPPLDTPEQKILNKFIGRWHVTYKLHKSEWSPEEKTGTEESTFSRAVGGRFVQLKTEDSDKTSSMSMLTYDEKQKTYRSWWFSSAGQTSESTGKWDEAAKIMTWTHVEDRGFTTTVRSHFTDADHTEWDVTVNDRTGKLFFRRDGTCVRAKEGGK